MILVHHLHSNGLHHVQSWMLSLVTHAGSPHTRPSLWGQGLSSDSLSMAPRTRQEQRVIERTNNDGSNVCLPQRVNECMKKVLILIVSIDRRQKYCKTFSITWNQPQVSMDICAVNNEKGDQERSKRSSHFKAVTGTIPWQNPRKASLSPSDSAKAGS